MKNNRTLLICLIIIVAVFLGAIIFVPQLTKKPGDDNTSSNLDISEYNINSFIDANDDNGGIADHVKGADIKTAKVVLFEYADYQCSACAMVSPWVDEILKEFPDEVAIIYRNLPLTSLHKNAIAAASAVEAAGLQGYWKEYGDLVFANQAEWFYATGAKRTEYFTNYFKSATNGEGDVNKFKADMAGDNVKAKVDFDRTISEKLNINGTPTFIDSKGNNVDWASDEAANTNPKEYFMNFFRNYFNKALGK